MRWLAWILYYSLVNFIFRNGLLSEIPTRSSKRNLKFFYFVHILISWNNTREMCCAFDVVVYQIFSFSSFIDTRDSSGFFSNSVHKGNDVPNLIWLAFFWGTKVVAHSSEFLFCSRFCFLPRLDTNGRAALLNFK